MYILWCHLLSVATIVVLTTPVIAAPRPNSDGGVAIASGNVEGATSEGVQKAAKQIKDSMNLELNPCDDFYEYACGRWEEHNIRDQRFPKWNSFYIVYFAVAAQVKDLLTNLNAPERVATTAIEKMGQLYRGCMDEGRLDLIKGTEFGHDAAVHGGWPVLHGETWRENDFDLLALMGDITKSRRVSVFVQIKVDPDQKNPERSVISVDQPSLSLKSREYFLDPKYSNVMKAYHTYITETVLLLAEDMNFHRTAEQIKDEVNKLIQFEKDLAQITVDETERRDKEKLYNLHKLSDLETIGPAIHWYGYMRQVMPRAMYGYLKSNPDVVVAEDDFLRRLSRLIEITDARTKANYMFWVYLSAWNSQLDKRYVEIRKKFNMVYLGNGGIYPRGQLCTVEMYEHMVHASSALYVNKHFNKVDKDAMVAMVREIQIAVRSMLMESDWMDEETKEVALEKLTSIRGMIGYPDFIDNDNELDKFYQELQFEPDSTFAGLRKRVARWKVDQSYMSLLKKNDRSVADVAASVVNAYYWRSYNTIILLAAILQVPFFDRTYPKAYNYGTMGTIVGHEIIHGFDDEGSQYGRTGSLTNWWKNETKSIFKEKTECIVNMYSNYPIPNSTEHLNGKNTQGENIGDIAGLKAAFKAYRRYVTQLGHEEERLPGLEQLSNDQIFFISHAQTYCSFTSPPAFTAELLSDPHTPMRYRAMINLQNQPDFANAFKCPVDSHMNPQHRCDLW